MIKIFKLNNWFFEIITFKPNDITDERFKLLAFDIWRVNGYEVLSTLSKAYYNNYIYIEFDLFRYRLLICIGKNFQVDYEYGLKERKKSNAKYV